MKSWWYRVLLITRNPIVERTTLFWHNHFTSSLQKVRWPPFLCQQNALFRIHAVGSFRALLSAVAKNPAMLLYFDTQTNHREHPNENFSRELFELLNDLFLTPQFWAFENRGCLIKSPVELMVGAGRLFLGKGDAGTFERWEHAHDLVARP